MTKSKKITIILSSILLSFLGFFGIFLANKNDSVVKADTVDTNYVYNGSSLWLPFTSFYENTTDNFVPLTVPYDGGYYIDFANFNFTISKPSITSINFGFSGGGNFANREGSYSESMTRFSCNVSNIDVSSNVTFYPRLEIYGNFHGEYYSGLTNTRISLYISSNSFSDFIPNIYRVNQYFDWNSSTYLGGNHVRYYDVNDNYLDISITHFFKPVGVYSGYSSDPFGQTSRSYFLTDSISDNQYFEAGRQQGLSDNQSNIFDEGYQKAIADNKQIWVNQGIQQGIEQSNTYTFLGLIGATIDAPIKAFTSFFDFELLGVNLKDFFFAILTFALVIVIVRFALAR